MVQKKTLQTVWLSAVVWGVACAMPASASLITLAGSFGSFSGPVAYPPSSPDWGGFGPSVINGTEVSPTSPSSRAGVGLVSNHALGTSSVEFYDDGEAHNLLQFTPGADVDVIFLGQEFLIGTFTLQNGNWFGGLGEGDSLFTFSVTTSSSDPLFDGHTFSDTIVFHVTQFAPGNTPQQNADVFSFLGRSDLGTMSVYESSDSPTGSNIGTIDFYGRIGSLIPTRFANAAGGAFIGATVPEPGIHTLILAGLGLATFASRRRRK
jgi:hypothetical protein